jgi:ABC-type phosphate/phosphonate transport system substrate-binding protein
MVLQTLVSLAVLSSSVVPARAARGPEIVIANEALVAGGTHVPENLAAFLRRLETVGGWPAGSLRGKAFTRPREALAYIRANKVPFAIVPPHQLVEARKDLKLEVVGRAVGIEGARPGYWGVALSGKRPYEHIEEAPGLRLAVTEAYDEQWLRVLLEGNVSAPSRHFKLVEVPTAADAVAAVLARKADVAMVYQSDFAPLKPRFATGGDLTWVYASDTFPPPAIVSINRHAPAPADRKRLTTALDTLCKGEGADACARMGILYVEPGKADSYNVVIQKYAQFR